jgi:hypothetical protein
MNDSIGEFMVLKLKEIFIALLYYIISMTENLIG